MADELTQQQQPAADLFEIIHQAVSNNAKGGMTGLALGNAALRDVATKYNVANIEDFEARQTFVRDLAGHVDTVITRGVDYARQSHAISGMDISKPFGLARDFPTGQFPGGPVPTPQPTTVAEQYTPAPPVEQPNPFASMDISKPIGVFQVRR